MSTVCPAFTLKWLGSETPCDPPQNKIEDRHRDRLKKTQFEYHSRIGGFVFCLMNPTEDLQPGSFWDSYFRFTLSVVLTELRVNDYSPSLTVTDMNRKCPLGKTHNQMLPLLCGIDISNAHWLQKQSQTLQTIKEQKAQKVLTNGSLVNLRRRKSNRLKKNKKGSRTIIVLTKRGKWNRDRRLIRRKIYPQKNIYNWTKKKKQLGGFLKAQFWVYNWRIWDTKIYKMSGLLEWIAGGWRNSQRKWQKKEIKKKINC